MKTTTFSRGYKGIDAKIYQQKKNGFDKKKEDRRLPQRERRR